MKLFFYIAHLIVAALFVLEQGCGFTVTNERYDYESLEPEEKSAVDVILNELRAFNEKVKALTDYNIDAVVNREAISVSFEEVLFSGNLGDNVIHVAVWENLSKEQHDLIRQWFEETTTESTRARHQKLFYQFLAVSQGAKQYMYEVLTTAWVYANRSMFNVERDSIRMALSHYVAVERKDDMWGFLTATCAPIIKQYDSIYGDKFDKVYLKDHIRELLNPENPTGYMYFTCRWIEYGMETAVDLSTEFDWIRDLPNAKQN